MSNRKVQRLRHAEHDAMVEIMQQIVQATCQHYHSPFSSDTTPNAALITSADASSLATSKTLAKELADDLVAHGADTTKHSAVDTITISAYASTPAEPANLTEVQNVLNEVKSKFNTHILNATPHRFANQVNSLTISTADASDQSTANALANAIKKALNAHDRLGCEGFDRVNN